MKAYPLDIYFSGRAYAFVFIFSRVGSMMMLFPGLAESYVPVRTRLLFAFLMSLVLMEPMMSRIPVIPGDIGHLASSITYEVLIGVFYGTFLRLMMGILEISGSIVALQIGLSNATILNPTFGVQSALPSAFLSLTGLVLLFLTGLDHALLRGLVATYDLFPPGGDYLPGDMTQTVIHQVNRTFVVGIEFTMPFIIVGLLMYVAMALMQRIMPQVQLFLVALPAQIWGGLTLLSLMVATIMALWLKYVNTALSTFFTG